jgi:DNA-binding transcriptional regulator GbsR (MarR family)
MNRLDVELPKTKRQIAATESRIEEIRKRLPELEKNSKVTNDETSELQQLEAKLTGNHR